MDEDVFRALGDPSRRALLDSLFDRDGQTLAELSAGLAMTRFGVMKHLRVLEEAGLLTTRRVGREKLHYLNPVRSKEHTSELQSQSNLVCRLLLEKKKKIIKIKI